ncbi:MAG: hypothetical protein ABS46_18280 [Cytophagaceae bacterium SCN 52-12]|nr:MAG: hypothetical protein ABS46_18280 [Cytophagaceae bacterium SCN 52-12]
MLLGLGLPKQVSGQQYPEVPAQLPFGGINVKFDQSAKSIMASDIKVLMINQKYWEEKLERALLYFPIIESIFIDEEIPMDFKYLAAQESSLIPEAVSSSNAVGFWQFKEETARELGLRVDKHVDERKNISSSTRAAAKYLKRSNSQFNNWVSSLYSYYQGVNGAMEKIPTNWANAYDINITGKTDRYVLRFFAYKIAFEAGLERYQSKNPITLIEANAGKGRSIEEISAELKVSSGDLKNYNVWLKGNKIPTDKSYYVTVPVASSKVGNVKESLAIVQSDNSLASKYEYEDNGFPVLKKLANQPSGYNSHVLYEINGVKGILARAGDYPNSLAKAGGLSPSKFRKYNDMDVNMPVVPGEVYYLAPKRKKAAVEFHTARPGETLHSISHMYGIRLKDLLKYNRILSKGYYLEAGRELWLTKRRPSNVKVKINEVPKSREIQRPSETEAVQQEIIAEAAPGQTERTAAVPAQAAEPKPEAVQAAQTGNVIPRDASERRKYTPKMAEPRETAKAAVDEPAADVRQEPAGTVARTTEAAPKAEKTEEAVVARPNSRIVIVTDDERPKPYVSRRAGSRPSTSEDVKPVYSPTPSAGAKRPPAEESAAAEVKRETEPVAASYKEPAAREPAASGNPSRYYTVVKGDTYYSISRRHNISITELLEMNNLKISDNLHVGKKLVVGGSEEEATASAAPVTTSAPVAATAAPKAAAPKPAPVRSAFHTVKKGETLFSISQKYGTSVQELSKLNGMKSTGLKVGQKLKVP